mmetsp:Transcript_76906/g.152224  ORF Transcript_76906/g.152224 Transcript_76906/m.152224 type:complete len:299 (-) Transcript_76906:69-965(-)|eukprot:CAMPEP_0172722762 /NCGR_PEP_ID=MMETSP1074-20121228/82248_1 /TAXON_ID=2916 /ORGANISM="Ceratium fusus, Strain PA161109" /LENGTH=298 /DNA_ID=CAMNT_0013548833 /DNA_START=49 /DNA_END=945 /DNA_ORIENTATION=-
MNWPGLFAWSTKYHDGTAPSQFTKMTDEDRKFLEKAMEEAFGHIEDPNQVMQEAINQIKAPERTNQSIITALEVMDRSCDDVDCARNAEKLDGIQPLLDLLGTHEGPIRVRALEILALLYSNNPGIQEAGFRRGSMKACLTVVETSPRGSDEREKAFRTLVALVRNMQAFEETFLTSEGGVALTLSFFDRCESSNAREKAMSFARCLLGNGRWPPGEAAALAAGLAPLLRGAAEESIQYRETLAECASEVALAFAASCKDGELQCAVKERLAQIQDTKDEETENEAGSLLQCVEFLSK